VDGGDTDIPRAPDQWVVGTEQAVERIGRGQHRQVVRSPPPLIPGQKRPVAWILTGRERCQHQLRQHAGIAQTEVESLARDRVDAMGSVSPTKARRRSV
jgi:hypothetical protein